MADPQAPPEYKLYRTRPRLPRRGGDDGSLLDGLREAPPGERRRRPITVGRVVRWLLLALVAWVGISLVLFLVSAQVNQDQVSAGAQAQLSDGGVGIFKPQTTLILGSDQRTAANREPGASTSGPSRSDSILLVRTGGGHSAKLSIPRDTVVDIPGHGRNKINAAYALGGPSLAIETVESYLGIKVNHLVEVNFENFPQLIDSLGGVTYRGGCVISRINGGSRNGGYTLRLKAGEHEIDGKQALALARTRKNNCAKREDDRTRARRQQKILGAIKDKVISFETFIRLPWVSWAAPRAVQSDMAGPSLLGLVGAELIGGAQKARVLKASGGITLPDGGAGLVVDESEKRTAVQNFLKG